MKKVLVSGVALAASLALGACGLGPATSGGGGGSGAASIVIKVGDNWNQTHPMAAVMDTTFKTQVEEKSGGAIAVETYHSGTLGNEADLWASVRNGTVEMVVIGTVMNQEYPTMLISDWPWLYRDVDHAKAVWTGEVAEELNVAFNEKFPETRILAWGPNSARTFTSNKKLESVGDFAGQKFRMPANPIHVGLAENLGASAQVIPLGELFSALETGVVDGQDNGMVTVVSEGLYEVQKWVYETNHIIATLEVIANESFMAGLTEEQQTIIADAAQAAAVQAWDDYSASIEKDRKFLIDQGLTVTSPTEADRQAMIDKTQPVVDKLLAENAWAKELTDKIRAVK
ncbi:MAG: TRAP transporter substrate-binding protein [Brooklawnia sp.]|jgi:tripartite ATP-independent transporter DctP family solute receptor